MRKLIMLLLCCGGLFIGAAAAQANGSSSKQQMHTALQRYYHADGFIKAIGHVARRTIYNPNHRIRLAWKRKLHHLVIVRKQAAYKIRALKAPPVPRGSNSQIICAVFGNYCSQAISVATCESGLSVYAVNGQYLGMFQMGEQERARYGHGSDAYTQAKAAYAYFRDSGSDWSPWSCKPY